MVSSGGGGWSQTNHAPNVTQSQTIAPVGGTVTPWQHPIVPYANSPSTVKSDQTGMESNNGALGQGGSSYGEPSGKGQQGHQRSSKAGVLSNSNTRSTRWRRISYCWCIQ